MNWTIYYIVSGILSLVIGEFAYIFSCKKGWLSEGDWFLFKFVYIVTPFLIISGIGEFIKQDKFWLLLKIVFEVGIILLVVGLVILYFYLNYKYTKKYLKETNYHNF